MNDFIYCLLQYWGTVVMCEIYNIAISFTRVRMLAKRIPWIFANFIGLDIHLLKVKIYRIIKERRVFLSYNSVFSQA
jgi:hypothetical protein